MANRNIDAAELTERRVEHYRTERQQHEDALLQDDISQEKFDRCRFVTQLVEFSHTRSGDVLIKLRVPYMYRHQASKLKDAYGIMLEATMEPWRQMVEARREVEENG